MFDHSIDVILEGKLPDEAEGRTTVKMANIVGIMTMKGMVVGSRYKQKDAYDIHSLVLYYKSSVVWGPNFFITAHNFGNGKRLRYTSESKGISRKWKSLRFATLTGSSQNETILAYE